jgi:hypothetical protein
MIMPQLSVRLRLDRAYDPRYSRLGPGWYLAVQVSQDEIRVQIPGLLPVAGDAADFETRELVASGSVRRRAH